MSHGIKKMAGAVPRPSVTKPAGSKKYFWGRISREEAEARIKERGSEDGMFLLRESVSSHQGCYAVSLCHQKMVHHYQIMRQPDGTVMIENGQKFPGPVELIEHHQKSLDGFLTWPVRPVERLEGTAPQAFRGLTTVELDYFLHQEAREMGITGDKLQHAFGPQREQLIKRVARNLHKHMPWYHGDISRNAAGAVIDSRGHEDGRFLMRHREENSYAITMSFKREAKHYKIDLNRSGKYAIQDGPKFDNLMELVDHYYNKADGLLCVLKQPIAYAGYVKKIPNGSMSINQAYGGRPSESIYENEDYPTPDLPSRGAHKSPVSPAPSQPKRMNGNHVGASNHVSSPPKVSDIIGGLEDLDLYSRDDDDQWDEPDEGGGQGAIPSDLVSSSDARQQIYDDLPTMLSIDPRLLNLTETLGTGNFGFVKMGFYQCGGKKIAVAVKAIKDDSSTSAKEFREEAKTMSKLRHPNIVRLIGVSEQKTLMIVLELAPLGPLNKFLKKPEGKQLRMYQLLGLMNQVCLGMEYLESQKFVHRDLAARNVLLVSTNFPKISDFGMSRALKIGNEYYKAQQPGKWPLKWYAPECLYYWTFDSKSDVWSFGITMWETLSGGQKPYKGMKGQALLEFLEAGQRLARPPGCPEDVYQTLLLCWNQQKEKRPGFKELAQKMRALVQTHKP